MLKWTKPPRPLLANLAQRFPQSPRHRQRQCLSKPESAPSASCFFPGKRSELSCASGQCPALLTSAHITSQAGYAYASRPARTRRLATPATPAHNPGKPEVDPIPANQSEWACPWTKTSLATVSSNPKNHAQPSLALGAPQRALACQSASRQFETPTNTRGQ